MYILYSFLTLSPYPSLSSYSFFFNISLHSLQHPQSIFFSSLFQTISKKAISQDSRYKLSQIDDRQTEQRFSMNTPLIIMKLKINCMKLLCLYRFYLPFILVFGFTVILTNLNQFILVPLRMVCDFI